MDERKNNGGKHQAMAQRGVSRPMMDNEDGKKNDVKSPPNEKSSGENKMMEMTETERVEMLERHHRSTLWIPFLLIILAIWLMYSPFAGGYAGERIAASNLLSGAALIVLTLIWIKRPQAFWAQWLISITGFWLLLAPLVFWTESAAAYQMNTLAGALAIALSILVPGMPGMIKIMKMGADVPPGWSYNPSSWLQRAPVIVLGFIGFFLSSYLAAFQLGYTHTVFDPFFAGKNGLSGTATVLTSNVSKSFPISDAGFGAVSYMLETLMGFMGGAARWRTMPWMVTFFGILVIPLGATSIVLVMLQPIAVGAWCAICLITAAAMLVMIPLTLDEVWAMAQFLRRKHREGKPFWRTFFYGDAIGDEQPENKQRHEEPKFTAPLTQTAPAMFWGMTLPWNLILSAGIGIWLMFAPNVFGTTGTFADSDHLVGALVVTWSVIVAAEVARAGRFLNALFGLWLIAAPFVLSGANSAATINGIVCGLLVIALCLPRGVIREVYGAWNPYIF